MKTLLFILISFVAFTATISGLVMISDPSGEILYLELRLLDGTPFKDFLIPGVLLATIVGGVNLLAVFYNMQRHPYRYNFALAGGAVLAGWLIAQVIFIHTLHWLHFAYLGIAVLIILIAYQLKGKWAV